jgi:hypothetical protein
MQEFEEIQDHNCFVDEELVYKSIYLDPVGECLSPDQSPYHLYFGFWMKASSWECRGGSFKRQLMIADFLSTHHPA